MSPQQFRPIRRQDIQFKRSLFRFTVLFSVVLVLGLLTRYSMLRVALKERITESARLPKDIELVVDEPEFRLRSGLLPVLGVAVNRLDIQNSKCPTQKLSAQDILIRLDPFSLMMGKMELGVLNVDFLEITFSKGCKVQNASTANKAVEKIKETLSKGTSSSNSGRQILPNQWLKKLFPDVADFLKRPPIKKINVDQFEIHFLESLDRQIKADGSLRIKLRDQITADMDLKNIHVGQNDFSFVSTGVGLTLNSKELSLEVKSRVREGKLFAKAQVLNEKDFKTTFHTEIVKLPLSSLVSGFYGRKELNYLWASCEIHGESPWSEIKSKKLDFKECKIDGPYGEVAFSKMDAQIDRLNHLELELSKIDLDKVLKNKRDLYFSGVFSNYGVLSSRAVFDNGKWVVDGHLLDSEFIFSNNNLRDIQKVKKLPFRFEGHSQSWISKFYDIELDEGEFAGELKVERRQGGQSQGRVAIHKLRLNPRIYKLMINSEPAELRLYGKFNGGEKGLENWSAMLATTKLHSEFYNFNNLKVKGRGSAGQMAELRVTIGDGSLSGSGPLFKWIQPTHLEKKWEYENLKFKELSTRLELSKDRSLKWKRGYIYLNNGWQLSTEGERSSDRQVQAWLQWDRPDRKYLKWNYKGSFFEGEWSPETPWVKEWLKDNPEFLKQNRSIGQQALEKVKDALKGSSSEKGS